MSFIVPFPGGDVVLNPAFLANVAGGSLSYAGLNLGTPQDGRYIVATITLSGNSNTSVSTCTIAGVSATPVTARNSTGGPPWRHASIWIALVPASAGDTGTVSFTLNGAFSVTAVTLYHAQGLGVPAAASTYFSTANSPSNSINVAARGFAIGVAASGGLSAPGATWSGIIKDTDNTTGVIRHTSASKAFATDQVALSTACSFSGGSGSVGVWAVWEP